MVVLDWLREEALEYSFKNPTITTSQCLDCFVQLFFDVNVFLCLQYWEMEKANRSVENLVLFVRILFDIVLFRVAEFWLETLYWKDS